MGGRPLVKEVRAYVVDGAGADYFRHGPDHWIDGKISTPMSLYEPYRATRSSWGQDVLGNLVVEIEDDAGNVGVGVTLGGLPAAYLVEHHLARFVEGARVGDVERCWDLMWRASLYYGRKGLAVHAVSAVDLAMWDLWGRAREEPVHALLGGAVRDELRFYATGPDPVRASELGFVGAKTPFRVGPWDGAAAIAEVLDEYQALRNGVGSDFWLMVDAWMSLDLVSAQQLADGLAELGFRWLEEPLPPDDYWGYRRLRQQTPNHLLIATGEHEYGLQGFRLLLEMECADIVQPDINWCGGMTELRRIAALAEAFSTPVVPHGSSVYSYHFMFAQRREHPGEFLMMHPTGAEVVPMFAPLFLDEPVPENGRLRLLEDPGFGCELNRELPLSRPFAARNGPFDSSLELPA